MIFREMLRSDIDFVKEHTISRGIFSKMPQQTEFSYCLEHEGTILGVGGISLINATTAWGWIDMTEYAKDHLVTSYHVIKEWMEMVCEEKGIKRLQAYVEEDFPEAIRLVEHLGFVQESVMKNFVGGKSAFLYVRFL